MYPWNGALSNWAAGSNFRIDALGLVTMLGSVEMDESIGRLVSSPFLQFLPLLGAFVVAGDRFTDRRPGYTLYAISGGIVTTELAGWFYRWTKSQRFETVRTRIDWEVGTRPPQWGAYLVGFLLVGLPLNGMLIAMTILSGDWWGFANAMSMTASIAVKVILVHMNSRAIDANIESAEANLPKLRAEYERELQEFESEKRVYKREVRLYREACLAGENNVLPDSIRPPIEPVAPIHPEDPAKLLVVTDDGRAISMTTKTYLVKHIFPANPMIKNGGLYGGIRLFGWAAFAVHVLSLGMSALHTQIYTVVLLLVATVLTRIQVGCEDFRIGLGEVTRLCWITRRLKATVSKFPASYGEWVCEGGGESESGSGTVAGRDTRWMAKNDVESNAGEGEGRSPDTRQRLPVTKTSRRRQDLYVWLEPTAEEEESMKAWGLVPRNHSWLRKYNEKKKEHAERRRGENATSTSRETSSSGS